MTTSGALLIYWIGLLLKSCKYVLHVFLLARKIKHVFRKDLYIIRNPLAATDLIIKKHIHSHLWNEEQTICLFTKVFLLSEYPELD